MNNQETLKKYAGAIIRGSIASVPLVGSLAVELLNVTIPNQRQERIEKLLSIVASRVFEINPEDLEEKFHSSDFIDVFEDVLFQSVRATSNERLEYLASVIEHGIKEKDIEHLQTKRLLSILAEINDIEIIILQSYERKNWTNENFNQKYSNIFNPSNLSPDKLSEHRVMKRNYTDHLINLGLIGTNEVTISKEQPGFLMTRLGIMLLQKIGVKQDDEKWIGHPINPVDAINSARQNLEQKEREIRKELEQETNKAKAVLEREVNNFVRKIERARRPF